MLQSKINCVFTPQIPKLLARLIAFKQVFILNLNLIDFASSQYFHANYHEFRKDL